MLDSLGASSALENKIYMNFPSAKKARLEYRKLASVYEEFDETGKSEKSFVRIEARKSKLSPLYYVCT
jgi:hypothetical protein